LTVLLRLTGISMAKNFYELDVERRLV
jgi:hypothetical protein